MTVADILLLTIEGLLISVGIAACERLPKSDYCRCPRCLVRAARRHLTQRRPR